MRGVGWASSSSDTYKPSNTKPNPVNPRKNNSKNPVKNSKTQSNSVEPNKTQ